MPWAKRVNGQDRDKLPQLYPTRNAARLAGRADAHRQSSPGGADVMPDRLTNCRQCGAVVNEEVEQTCWLCGSDNVSGSRY